MTRAAGGRGRQRGVALAVGLLLMLVLTLLAMAAMRMSTQQARMAANFQWQAGSFAAAEAVLRMVESEARADAPADAGRVHVLVEAMDRTGPDPVRRVAAGADTLASAHIQYRGPVAAPGYSLSVDGSTVTIHEFRMIAVGEVAGVAARSRHEQGLQRVGPGVPP